MIVCDAQRIASISTIEATLSLDQNNELDTSQQEGISQQTTVMDLFLRPNLSGDTKFVANITTFSSTGDNGADFCDNPSADGVCSIATPVDIVFETSPLVQRYMLKRRQMIPYLYYHRKFITCEAPENQIDERCMFLNSVMDRQECICRDTEDDEDDEEFRVTFTGNDGTFTFQRFEPISIRKDEIEDSRSASMYSILREDFSRNPDLYFNAIVWDDEDGERNFTAPAFSGDADENLISILTHWYDQNDGPWDDDDDADPYYSHYVARRLAPLCAVYDIDPIPEQVMHVTITMTPQGRTSSTQTLTLSTVNEANGLLFTSGSSSNNQGGFGAFTARIENTQSATTSYGPTLSGTIVMCADDPDNAHNGATNPSTFINTGSDRVRLDVTQNPWTLAFPPEEESQFATSAQGRIFDAETIAALQNKSKAEVGPKARIYYYNNLESLAIGSQCGQLGVTGNIYSIVPPAISNLVKPNTVKDVSLDVIRGNDSYPSALPTCIPGFGPSITRDVPLPGRVIAEQSKFLYKYSKNPSAMFDPPYLPPVYNINDPNMYFFDRYMYRTAEQSDIETEVILTISGSFLGVREKRAAGSIDRDSTYCALLSEDTSESTVGVLSAKVCNDAERFQVTNPDAMHESGDGMDIEETIQIDQTYAAQFTLEASCAPESGIAIKSATPGDGTVLKFTGILEPKRCERLDFDLVLTSDTLDENSVCSLVLISNDATNNPGNVFLDSVNTPCSLTVNYTEPPSLQVNADQDVIQNLPLPDVLDDDDDDLDTFAQILIYACLFGIPAVMIVYAIGVCGYYRFYVIPQTDKYL